MLAVLCHDLGKPATTRMLDGRLRRTVTRRRDRLPTSALPDRWNVHRLHGYDVQAQVLGLVGNHLKPGQFYDDRERVSTAPSAVWPGSASPRCSIASPAPIAWDGRATCPRGHGVSPWSASALEVAERAPDPLFLSPCSSWG